MYKIFFLAICLTFCLNIEQDIGFIALLNIKADILKEASDLSIRIIDLKSNITFEREIIKRDKNLKFECILGSLNLEDQQKIFNKKNSQFLAEFVFKKNEQENTKHIAFKRNDGTNSFKMCSETEHLAIITGFLLDLIIKIEEKNEFNLLDLLKEIMENYLIQQQLLYKVIKDLHNSYMEAQEAIHKTNDTNHLTINPESIIEKKKKRYSSILEKCKNSARHYYLLDEFNVFNFTNTPCFPSLVSKEETDGVICGIYNKIYDLLARKTSEDIKANFFNFSSVNFTVKFKKCVVLKNKINSFSKIDANENMLEFDQITTHESTNKDYLDKEDNNIFEIQQTNNVIFEDIKQESKKSGVYKKTITHFFFEHDIYLPICGLTKMENNNLRIFYKYENNSESFYEHVSIDLNKINCTSTKISYPLQDQDNDN